MTAAIPNRISATLCQSIAITFVRWGRAPRLRGNRCNALSVLKRPTLSRFRCFALSSLSIWLFGFAVRLALFGFALNLAFRFRGFSLCRFFGFRSSSCGSVATPSRKRHCDFNCAFQYQFGRFSGLRLKFRTVPCPGRADLRSELPLHSRQPISAT